MAEWIQKLDWKVIIVDIVIPVLTFIGGFFTGRSSVTQTAKASINGDGNSVMQNRSINDKK